MNFLKALFSILCLLFFEPVFSQNQPNDTIKKEIPVSIYTSTQISNNFNSLLKLNKRLNLKSYNFMVLDEKHMELGDFSVPLHHISLRSSNYNYDTYNKTYQQSILEAAFFNLDHLYRPRTKNSL